jgi:proteasome assembly chaperone (PAC2) family protein
MATAQQVTTAIASVQTIGDSIIKELEAVDPSSVVPAGTAGLILDLSAQMVTAAITAFAAASGTTIDAASIAALMPNATPLSAPTA